MMADNYRAYTSSELQQVINVAVKSGDKFSEAAEAVRRAQTTLRTISTAGGNLSGGGTEATLSRISTTCQQFTELENEMKDFIKKAYEAKQEMDKDNKTIDIIRDSVETDKYRNGNSYSNAAAYSDLMTSLEDASNNPGAWDNIKTHYNSKYSGKLSSGEIGYGEVIGSATGTVIGGFSGMVVDSIVNAGEAFGFKYDFPPSFTYQASDIMGDAFGFAGRCIDRGIEKVKSIDWRTVSTAPLTGGGRSF